MSFCHYDCNLSHNGIFYGHGSLINLRWCFSHGLIVLDRLHVAYNKILFRSKKPSSLRWKDVTESELQNLEDRNTLYIHFVTWL